MKQKLAQLWSSNFVRSVAVFASGTAGARAITMAFAPLITRLYGPEAYGLLGTFSAMISVLAPVAALTYPIAMVLPKDEADARGLAKLAFIVSGVICGLTLVVFALAGAELLTWLGAGEIAAFALLVPLVMLFTAWSQIPLQWLIRHKAFKATARVSITHALVVNGAKTLGGLVHPAAAVLVSLQTLGVALKALLLAAAARLVGRHPPRQHGDDRRTSLVELGRRHGDFPLYRAPQDFINAASQSLPVLMLAALTGPAGAGFYALTRTVLGLPSSLVAQSVGKVFYPRVTEAYHQGESCFRLIGRATLALAGIGVVPFAILVAFGPWLFQFVFGAEWDVAGQYARWLAVMYFFNFINKPSVAAVPVLGRQRGMLIYEIFSTGSKVIALYLGLVVYSSDRLAVALFGIVGALAYIVLILWVLGVARRLDAEESYASKAG